MRVAPVGFSVVCFRAAPPALGGDAAAEDSFTERLMHAANATGEVMLSHAKLGGRLVIRLAVGSLRTTEEDVARAWRLLEELAACPTT